MSNTDLSGVDWFALVQEVRRRGHAVAVLTAEEIGAMDADRVEDVMSRAGADFIADHGTGDQDEDEPCGTCGRDDVVTPAGSPARCYRHTGNGEG